MWPRIEPGVRSWRGPSFPGTAGPRGSTRPTAGPRAARAPPVTGPARACASASSAETVTCCSTTWTPPSTCPSQRSCSSGSLGTAGTWAPPWWPDGSISCVRSILGRAVLANIRSREETWAWWLLVSCTWLPVHSAQSLNVQRERSQKRSFGLVVTVHGRLQAEATPPFHLLFGRARRHDDLVQLVVAFEYQLPRERGCVALQS